jgi:hypothetical protein
MLHDMAEAWDRATILAKLAEKKLRVFLVNSYKLQWYHNFLEFMRDYSPDHNPK